MFSIEEVEEKLNQVNQIRKNATQALLSIIEAGNVIKALKEKLNQLGCSDSVLAFDFRFGSKFTIRIDLDELKDMEGRLRVLVEDLKGADAVKFVDHHCYMKFVDHHCYMKFVDHHCYSE